MSISVGAIVLNTVSKNNLRKDERIIDLEQNFEDAYGSTEVKGFDFVKDARSLIERYPAPYLFCWYDAAEKDGNRVVNFSVRDAHLKRYYLSQEDVAQLRTVIIAVRHTTVRKPVVTQRIGLNKYGYYKHDYDYDLSFFNLDTKEWSVMRFFKNGEPEDYQGRLFDKFECSLKTLFLYYCLTKWTF